MATQAKRKASKARVRTVKRIRAMVAKKSTGQFEDRIAEAVKNELVASKALMICPTDQTAQEILSSLRKLGRPSSLAEIKAACGLTMARTIYWVSHMSLSGLLTRLATDNGQYVYGIAHQRVQPLIERHAEALAHLVGLSKSHPGIARMVDAACESFENLKGALS